MSTHDPGAYGAVMASRYDELYGEAELETGESVALLHWTRLTCQSLWALRYAHKSSWNRS
jgi:hypothetical protein